MQPRPSLFFFFFVDFFLCKVTKTLTRTDKAKKLRRLLEETATPPKMRELSKLNKSGVPIRPIISWTGSGPYRLAKTLAKPFSASLGILNEAHLRNSADLIRRVKEVNFEGRKMASFDVRSLFTHTPEEGGMDAVKKAVENISNSDKCLNKANYVELVSLCVNYCAFVLEGQEYEQHRSQAIGSPLSAVIASLFMEVLEKDDLARIMGRIVSGSVMWTMF